MITAALALLAVQPAPLPPHFAPMAFLVGHCWEGRFESGEVDTHCFERACNGAFIRDRHGQPGDTGNIRQQFLLRVPSRLIVFRTVQTPPRFPHAAEFKQVTSVVEIEPAGSGTRVRLSGVGYPAGAAGDTLLGFFREGNRTSLQQLRTRFVSGPIDWTARRARP